MRFGVGDCEVESECVCVGRDGEVCIIVLVDYV